jgi:hypothetical protein
MLGPQRFLPDREPALEERLGVRVATLVLIVLREVAEAGGDVGMLGPQRLLPDRERAFVERFGVGVASLGRVDHREVAEAGGDVGMLGPQHFLPDREPALEERLGVRVVPVCGELLILGKSVIRHTQDWPRSNSFVDRPRESESGPGIADRAKPGVRPRARCSSSSQCRKRSRSHSGRSPPL